MTSAPAPGEEGVARGRVWSTIVISFVTGLAALVACGSKHSACSPPPGVDCRAGLPEVILLVSERVGAVSGVVVSNVFVTVGGERRDGRKVDCNLGGVGGAPYTVCFVYGVGPGRYEFDVSAPGLDPRHVGVDVPPNAPTECCPATYAAQEVPVHLWRPLDPACAWDYGKIPGDEVTTASTSITCEVNPDLPPMPAQTGSCADLVPARVAPRSITMYDGMSDFCGQATSDASGTFMAPKYQNAMITLVPEPISFWGGYGAWSVQTQSVAGHDGLYYAQVVPGPSGFVAFSLGHGVDYPGRTYSVFDGRGNEIRPVDIAWQPPFTIRGPRWPADVALAGDGRSVMTVATAGCDDTMFGLHAMGFAANGDVDVPRFPVVAISGEAFEARAPDRFALYPKRMTENILAGMDGAGRILVTWEGGVTCGPRTIAARWFDPSGAPLTPVFRAATDANPPLRMARLMDGSLVLQTMYDGKWIRRFVAPVAAAGPVPDWLAARGDEIVTVRGGRAYAAFPVDTECNPRIEILSPIGEVCGVLGYPKVPGATIEPCDPRSFWPAGRLHVGADGSVSRLKRQVGNWTCTSPTTGYGTNCCEYEWWLGELR